MAMTTTGVGRVFVIVEEAAPQDDEPEAAAAPFLPPKESGGGGLIKNVSFTTLEPPSRKISRASIFGSTPSIDVLSLQVVVPDQSGVNNNKGDVGGEEVKEDGAGAGGDVKAQQSKGWRRYLGLLFTLLSINLLSLTTTIMKRLSHIHPFNVGIWCAPAALIFTAISISYTVLGEKAPLGTGILPLREHKKDCFLLWIRAIINSVATYCTMMAFKYVTASDVRTVVAAAVIVVYIFGWMFLGERCGVVPVITAVVALTGIGIMTRPPILTGATKFEITMLYGIGLSFAVMVLISMNLVIIRYLNQINHGITNLVVYLWSLAQGLTLSFTFGVFEVPSWRDLGALTGAGLCLSLALALLVLALQREEAGMVALVRTSEVIFVFFWQWVIVGTYPDLISVLGATLVISGVMAVTMRKWVESLPKHDPKRRRFNFLLK